MATFSTVHDGGRKAEKETRQNHETEFSKIGVLEEQMLYELLGPEAEAAWKACLEPLSTRLDFDRGEKD